MEKEEILEKSRKENKNKDIAELEVINRAGKIAYVVGALLCCIISFGLEFNENNQLRLLDGELRYADCGVYCKIC